MSGTRRWVTRREFLQDAAIAAGSAVFASLVSGPAAAGQAADTKIGSRLIGKLEGPELLLDPAKWPTKLGEAPMLAELVKSGKLPPVKQRVPEEPMVVKPLHAIGRYGGTWRRAFTGPGDGENGNRINATDKILFWDYTGTKIRPCVARAWQVSDDGKAFVLFLRKGMKWSDGHPFTADDFVFWYEDIYLNKNIQPTPHPDFMVNGKPGVLKKRDEYTVVFEFPEPNYLFVDILAGSTAMGGGQTREQHLGRTMGAYMPAHYLQQFHPKYAAEDELVRKAKAAGFDGWLSCLRNRWDWRLNTELPILAPWKTVTPINTPTWVLERNPYYYAIDSEGNQLPYIDKISMALAENLEVLNLRTVAGQYDLQERHTALAKLPVFLENRSKGSYEVHLDPAANGSDAALHTNQSFEADAEIAKWLQNRDFRRALSLGIDRDQLNETFWLGVGTPGSVAPNESMPESPGLEYRKRWSTHNPKQANELLDKAGLAKKDGEGYRMRTDGKGRLRIELLTPAGAFMPYGQMAEMIREQWKTIGIQGDVKEVERNLFFTKTASNEHQIAIWENGGSEVLYLHPRHAIPVDPASALQGLPIARWFASDGQHGKEPRDPQLKRALELFRSAPGKKLHERITIGQEIWKIMVDEQFSIGLVGQSPAAMGVRIVSKRLGNIPARQVNAQHTRTPSSSHPATFYFKS
jgi:peptide/nickel transport system substrate-binding protein